MKRAVVFLNFGGPNTLADVRPYLYRLFSDPAILVGVPWPFRQILAFLIATIRGFFSRKIYAKIGGGSPQLRWTQLQAAGVEQCLPANMSSNDTKVVIAMRCWNPSIETVLAELKLWGAEEMVLFPLFPQYSSTTSGSCFQEVDRVLAKMKWQPKVQKIATWNQNPQFIALHQKRIEEALKQMRVPDASKVHFLFSAHSLPMRVVRSGDPYVKETEQSMQAIMQKFQNPYSIAYQSRIRGSQWLAPYLNDEIKRLGDEGVKHLLVIPISFVSDHIETLYELDLVYSDLAKQSGIQNYQRTQAFNDSPHFAETLVSVLIDNASLR